MTVRLILIPIHDFSAGGTELIAFRLARHWLAAGRRVTILAGASDGPLRPRVPEGAQVQLLSPSRPRSSFSRLRLGRQMGPAARATGADAVFIPGNFHFMLGAGLRVALPDAAIVAKASNPVWTEGRMPLQLARSIVALGTRGIDRIVAMSDALAPEVARFVAPARVAVIDDPFLDDAAPSPRSRTHAPAAPLALLTVARLEPQKDPGLAIATLAALRAGGIDARLTILGEGPMRPALERRIGEADLHDHVALPGYVADPGPHYEAADLLLMTSRFEGVPAVIGEGLIRGLPFVATDCSAWLRMLAGDHPALGTVITERTPQALAGAVRARAALPPPDAGAIEAAIGRHRAGPAAQAYLALFDALADRRGERTAAPLGR